MNAANSPMPVTPTRFPDPLPAAGPARTAARWAAVLLVATVGLGLWLRLLFARPELVGATHPVHLLHAHSHVGFFGWLVPALGAALVARSELAGWRATALRLHAHVLGVLTLAALASFLRDGYGGASIPISAAHVALWWALVALAWPLTGAAPVERRLLRGAMAMLVLAGLTTVAPVVLLARGVTQGWWRELGIRLFLGTFLHGWVGLGVMGLALGGLERRGRLPRPRLALATAALVAAGTLPATLLYVAVPPPAPWLLDVGRLGSGLVGLGTLGFAALWLRAPLPVGLRLAALAAALAGGLELLAGAGVGHSLLHARPIVVAFVHLHLLGVATPVLLVALAPALRARGEALVAAGGLATMLVALVALGWPALYGASYRLTGADAMSLLRLAVLGGAVSALALATWAAGTLRRPRRPLGERAPLPAVSLPIDGAHR